MPRPTLAPPTLLGGSITDALPLSNPAGASITDARPPPPPGTSITDARPMPTAPAGPESMTEARPMPPPPNPPPSITDARPAPPKSGGGPPGSMTEARPGPTGGMPASRTDARFNPDMPPSLPLPNSATEARPPGCWSDKWRRWAYIGVRRTRKGSVDLTGGYGSVILQGITTTISPDPQVEFLHHESCQDA